MHMTHSCGFPQRSHVWFKAPSRVPLLHRYVHTQEIDLFHSIRRLFSRHLDLPAGQIYNREQQGIFGAIAGPSWKCGAKQRTMSWLLIVRPVVPPTVCSRLEHLQYIT